jgi:hypothetical protein
MFGLTMFAQEIGLSFFDGVIMLLNNKYAPDKRTAILDIKFDVKENAVTISGETNIPVAKEELKELLKNYLVTDKMELLPSKSLKGFEKAVVTLSVGNLRSEPNHSAELITQALMGTSLIVLKKGPDDFYLVQTPDNYIGWIDDAGVQTFNESDFKKWMSADKIIFTDIYGFVYENEGMKSGTISDITAGGILLLKSVTKKGYLVELPDGREGFIPVKLAKPLKKWLKGLKPDPNEIIKTAKKFLGIPYLWGGTSPKGLDCSGFTKTVYFLNGILLARDASQQCLYGEDVDIKQGFDKIKRGDLLFFGPKPEPGSKQRITHVGIYLGNKEFIHAAGRVRINSFDSESPIYSEYRSSMLVFVRRILTSLDTPGIIKLTAKNFFN